MLGKTFCVKRRNGEVWDNYMVCYKTGTNKLYAVCLSPISAFQGVDQYIVICKNIKKWRHITEWEEKFLQEVFDDETREVNGREVEYGERIC